MMKKVVVINGKGTAGKDTLCEFIGEQYRVQNISAITPIKEAAVLLGWNGEKSGGARRFLADLKKASVAYNDYPNRYLVGQYHSFLRSEAEILFVHIREPEQIYRFIDSIEAPVTTLLVKRPESDVLFGNEADDNVDEYDYDYIYINDRPLSESKAEFALFFRRIIDAEEM